VLCCAKHSHTARSHGRLLVGRRELRSLVPPYAVLNRAARREPRPPRRLSLGFGQAGVAPVGVVGEVEAFAGFDEEG
jgi:hypothetical protein